MKSGQSLQVGDVRPLKKCLRPTFFLMANWMKLGFKKKAHLYVSL